MLLLLKQLGKLLDEIAAYLAAQISRHTQAVRDDTEARSILAKELAVAAAKVATMDQSIVHAAAIHWMPNDLRKLFQESRSGIPTPARLSELNSPQ